MKRNYLKKVHVFTAISLLFLIFFSCKKDYDSITNFGPFKPVSNIDDIIILGNNDQFVAYNVRTKQVEETYKLPKSYAAEAGYSAGHLLLTVAIAPGSKTKADKFNIDIKTGSVVEHTMNGTHYSQTSDERIIEASTLRGDLTYRYDVVANKMVATYSHPIYLNYSSYSFQRNDTIYWFPETFSYPDNSNYIVNSFDEKIYVGDFKSHFFVYRKNGFVVHVVRNDNGTSSATLDKLNSLIPLKTSLFFKKVNNGIGGFTETMMYNSKVVVFGTSELYLLDSVGNKLFEWGDIEEAQNNNLDYKSFDGHLSAKIIDDKLYAFGQRYNYKDNPPTHTNCCVEIDLITGNDNWIEVWKGW